MLVSRHAWHNIKLSIRHVGLVWTEKRATFILEGTHFCKQSHHWNQALALLNIQKATELFQMWKPRLQDLHKLSCSYVHTSWNLHQNIRIVVSFLGRFRIFCCIRQKTHSKSTDCLDNWAIPLCGRGWGGGGVWVSSVTFLVYRRFCIRMKNLCNLGPLAWHQICYFFSEDPSPGQPNSTIPTTWSAHLFLAFFAITYACRVRIPPRPSPIRKTDLPFSPISA